MGTGRMFIAPFRFADFSNTFRYNGEWYEKIDHKLISLIHPTIPAKYETIDLDTMVGYRLVDMTSEQMFEIEYFYGPRYG